MKTIPNEVKAAKSLMKHIGLSLSQATVGIDENTIPPTLRVYVFDVDVYRCLIVPCRWSGYRVTIVHSGQFRPLVGEFVK